MLICVMVFCDISVLMFLRLLCGYVVMWLCVMG